MKYLKISLTILVAFAMTSWSLSLTSEANASPSQGQSTALERGYRTGYSDGYNAGFRDLSDHATRDYLNKDEYQRADRSYNQAWGTLDDYRDGYQQGFEEGYTTGYDQQPFNSNIPAGLARRGTVNSGPVNSGPVSTVPDNTANDPNVSVQPIGGPATSGPVLIPRNAILLIELETALSTDVTQQGDRFQARVLEPREYEGAIIEGRVTRVKRAGKVKGTSELQLSFESIRIDNRTTGFSAEVVEIMDMGNGTATVDSEGGVKGRSSTKDDVSKVGASTGIGAIIGAIVGGGKGAAIGAAIGGSVGTAGVLTSRGKDVRLDRGQQLKIRAATETRIQ